MDGAEAEQSRKVLIVEDDVLSYTGLKRLLEHYGCEVDHAGTVADGIKQLEGEPEFVFLDLMLPDGEGTRVLERVRMGNMASRVIVVSGITEPGMLWRVKALQPEAMLQKPVDFLKILELMKPAA
ncbi:MAG TPA: response regulator [Tepidisphaeraceae bacterium]|jgi:DNA-binding response OmpR family regulator|nr:response regulator [Tepidisphaeraceae bacterium]